MIRLTIPGPPVGKQRPRICRSGHAFTPAKTVNYEALVKHEFAFKYPDFVPMSGPIWITLMIYVMPSKETMRKIKKGIAMKPTIEPDLDNVIKTFADALGGGLAYMNDKQIISVIATKDYSVPPRVEVEMNELKNSSHRREK